MTSAPAPIVLFAYRRPEHLEATLEALRRNPEARDTELHVYADAPKDTAAETGVREVRRILARVEGFKSIQITHRPENFGLARNITDGVADVFAIHDRLIVLEDDIVVSPFFLRFMNEALTLYRDEPRVGSISGYCYPLDRPVPETFFIRGADCWGWATWRDRWRSYSPDGSALLAELRRRGLTHAFDFDGTMGFTAMLEDQIAGKNDSWAVRWHAACFLNDLLILYPSRPLVNNIGRDGSGTHFTSADILYDVGLSPTPVTIGGTPVEQSEVGRAAFCAFFRGPQPKRHIMDFATLAVRRAARSLRLVLSPSD
jgi:hypothetical protein